MKTLPPNPTNDNIAQFLEEASAVDVVLAAQCGQLSGIGCLCEDGMLQIAAALLHSFTEVERRLIMRATCGCVVQAQPQAAPAAVQTQPTGIVPAMNTTPVATPTTSCPQGTPPERSYT